MWYVREGEEEEWIKVEWKKSKHRRDDKLFKSSKKKIGKQTDWE